MAGRATKTAPTAIATPPDAAPTAATVSPVTPAPAAIKEARSLKARATSPGVTDAELASLTQGNTAFAFELYRALSGSDSNLFYSPYSISLGLAMAYAGAGGETERQMAGTLRFHLPQDRLHPAFNALDLALASRSQGRDGGGFSLNIANSAWGQESHGFLTTFLDALAENYGEEVRAADFRRNPEDARARINDWVADETEDRIKNLIPPDGISPLTRLVLANAIYFNAAWRLPFEEKATARLPFFSLDGGESEVPMMRQEARFGYARGDGYQAVELLYEGREMAMTVLLPDTGRFSEFENSLGSATVDGILQDTEIRLVRLTMPKFEMESSFSLADTLEGMGMANAFDERLADFSGMDGLSCPAGDGECLLISDVVHKAFVSVDESGTEAAAATAVEVGVTRAVAPTTEPIEVTVDRPFIFLVRDRATDAVLFVGRMLQP